jgi:LacI family transcriptional regulator
MADKTRKPEALKKRRTVTIHDVAAEAGVSTMTVSNAILGRSARVSADTKQRIARVIEKLGYRPNSTARGLRTSAWRSIGLLVADDSLTFLAGSFMSNLVAGLCNFLSERDHALLLQGLRIDKLHDALVVRDILTDGICTSLQGSEPGRRRQIESLQKLGQPIILFQENLRFPEQDICVVRLDDRGGGRLLGREIIDSGAKSIAMITPGFDWPGMAERVAGVSEVVKELGKRVKLRVLESRSVGADDVRSILSQDIADHGLPDAVVAANDDIGLAVLQFLVLEGIEVPQRVLLSGFNTLGTWRNGSDALPTVRLPAYELGLRGAEAMLERLRTGRFASREIVLPVELRRG